VVDLRAVRVDDPDLPAHEERAVRSQLHARRLVGRLGVRAVRSVVAERAGRAQPHGRRHLVGGGGVDGHPGAPPGVEHLGEAAQAAAGVDAEIAVPVDDDPGAAYSRRATSGP
jgi:hypothetical protein